MPARRLTNSSRRNQRGFSLVESIFAAVLIAVVGVIIGQLIQKNTLSMIWNRQTRRAANLADMVIEKYDFLATSNFTTLEQYNQTGASPASFFGTAPSSADYRDMRITTVVDPTGADGTRKLNLTIQWGTGGPNQSFHVAKFLAASSSDPGGAPVYVQVLDNNGQGMEGFEVRAEHHYNPAYTNSVGTNEVIGYTDANGAVTLNNVSVAPALQPMGIYARKPGTPSVQPRSAGFVRGYYAPPNYTWNRKNITVSQTRTNTVTFDMRNDDFIAMGSLSGTLAGTGGATASGVELHLQGYAVSDSREVLEATWVVYTDPTGHFEYNNLLAGADTLLIVGTEGSSPDVPPGPGFVQGTAGFDGNYGAPWGYLVNMPNPPTDITNYALKIRPLGSLDVLVTDTSGALLPNSRVCFVWPDIGHSDRGYSRSCNAVDNNSHLELWNLFPGDNVPTSFDATLTPTSCASNGNYLYNSVQNVSANQTNSFTLQLSPGARIVGQLTNNVTGSPLDNIRVTVSGLDGSGTSGVTDTNGNFTICGISPNTNPSSNWPIVTFNLLDQSSRRVSGTFSGQAVDQNYTSQGLRGVGIGASQNSGAAYIHNGTCASDPSPSNNSSDNIATDSGGLFGPICAYIPYSASLSKKVILSENPGVYTPQTNPIVIDNTTMIEGLYVSSPYYSQKNTDTSVTCGGTYANITIQGALITQKVSGTIKDTASGIPLAGVSFDPCSACSSPAPTSCPVSTDASGRYGPVNVCVQNRTANAAGNVTISVPSGVTASNTTFAYVGGSGVANLTTDASPSVPITVDISLSRVGGGM